MRNKFLLLALLILGGFLQKTKAQTIDEIGRPAEGVQQQERVAKLKADLEGAKAHVEITKLADGSLVYVVRRLGKGTDRLLTPEEFTRLYYNQQNNKGCLMTLLNITSPIGIIWIVVGLGGQALFAGRMFVQWIASEKEKRSVIPLGFWWMSLIGATMQLVYFIWRRDIVGILGQATGWYIYIRNLILIHRSRT